MDIRLVSSLSPDDESKVADGLLEAICALLDQLPIAYSLQVRTAVGEKLEHTHCPDPAADDDDLRSSSIDWEADAFARRLSH